MSIVVKNAQVFEKSRFRNEVRVSIPVSNVSIELNDGIIVPGFVDVHVHLRQPGFSYKETIFSGTRAAARSGYCLVCPMPNLDPAPDCLANLEPQLELIRRDAAIETVPYGTISKGRAGKELSAMEEMAPYVAGFSDDGSGVQNDDLMRAAMKKAKRLGKIIAAHCEDNSLLHGGYIHDGEYAKLHGHKGISSESEWRQIARDLELVRETGCAYHVCHISTKESVELIRRAKAEGLDVTCETGPHYLVLTDMDLQEDGRFKMNPPLRGKEDQQALLEGILDGTVDMIATDHAPHSAEEKAKGLAGSAMGITGLETAFPILYTKLVRTGVLTLEKLIELMAINPRKRFGFPLREDDFAVWDLNTEYAIDPAQFCSMGKSTPFTGEKVYGRCLLNVCGGKAVWQAEQ